MIIVSICIGSACHLKGSYDIIQTIQDLITKNKLEDKVNVKASFCLGHCTEAVSVSINEKIYSVSPQTVADFFHKEIIGRLS